MVVEELKPVGRLASENSMEDCIPWEEAHPGAGKDCEGKEWQIKMYHELTLLFSVSPVPFKKEKSQE